MSISERVKELVDLRFLGNVNAAARAWSIPQPTLRRIVAGLSERPRADVLVRIAKANETSVEWLLTGEGQAPEEDAKRPLIGSVQEWKRLVDDLVATAKPLPNRATQDWGLTSEQEDALIRVSLSDLPFAVYYAASYIDPSGPRVYTADKDSTDPTHLLPRQALDSVARYYIRFLEAAIAKSGKDLVMAKIRFFLPELIFGFSRAGLHSRPLLGLTMPAAEPPHSSSGKGKTGKPLLHQLAQLAHDDISMWPKERRSRRKKRRPEK